MNSPIRWLFDYVFVCGLKGHVINEYSLKMLFYSNSYLRQKTPERTSCERCGSGLVLLRIDDDSYTVQELD